MAATRCTAETLGSTWGRGSSDFECGVVGARRAGVLNCWDFDTQTSSEFKENAPKIKIKHPVGDICVDENVFLMLEENGQTGVR